MYCAACGFAAGPGARFCAHCGKTVDGRSDATALGDDDLSEADQETLAPERPATPWRTPSALPPQRRPHSSPSGNPLLSSSEPIGGGRFTPGAIIVDRYRIVALLGRGGMGEVYRAEDLKLSQVVAIKFLPIAFSQDPSILTRFHSEVRIARQVSHPNVCRVFDIGDAEGVPFLTMEYVDGEDLSSLVRRIGRLPQDKAVEVSRQICAGLAAAHDKGVVHRDLKPSNLMLDGSGKIRITDFGLAGIAANIQGSEVRAGTPAYMAPEQLSGKEVTVKSDLYSLGLVMYEILTGKRAWTASTMAELMKARAEGVLTVPSEIVRDLDPLIERVVMRCLDQDPARRPVSALSVAAALPGGDPLAAALAAGETPSPEMVAAAGETEAMQPKLAAACLLGVFLLMAAAVLLAIRESGLERIHPQNPPEVMAHKAREIAASFGYAAPKDRAYGYGYDDEYLDYLDKKNKEEKAWTRALTERPPVLRFWYRESPEELLATGYSDGSLTPGVVRFNDPPATFSGMVNIRLDTMGRLLYFHAIPPEKLQQAETARKPVDWRPLFDAAGLNAADFQAGAPVWNSLASSDTRAAWDGLWPGTQSPLHLEAASFEGRFVYFQFTGDWTTPSRMAPPEPSSSQKAGNIFGTSLAICLVVGGIRLAYRNYSRGRGDRRGAWRLAGAAFLTEILLFFLWGHLSFSASTLFLLAIAVSTGLFVSAFLWVLYLALEPYVRSKWPQTIVSWSRLLAGSVRDPLVGRDVLLGSLLGMIWVVVFYAGYFFDVRVGDQPLLPTAAMLDGTRSVVSYLFGNLLGAVLGVVMFFFVLVFLRVLVRNRWAAAAIFVAIFSAQHILNSTHRMIDAPLWIIIYVIAAFAVARFGLIVLATANFTADVLLNVAFTRDFSVWYAPGVVCVALSFLALAVWGYFTAVAGQRLFKGEAFD